MSQTFFWKQAKNLKVTRGYIFWRMKSSLDGYKLCCPAKPNLLTHGDEKKLPLQWMTERRCRTPYKGPPMAATRWRTESRIDATHRGRPPTEEKQIIWWVVCQIDRPVTVNTYFWTVLELRLLLKCERVSQTKIPGRGHLFCHFNSPLTNSRPKLFIIMILSLLWFNKTLMWKTDSRMHEPNTPTNLAE